ncbi:amidase signature domain-containing protein [Cercophora newfieldiana]|uniref:Amidase signature domain-containing protein n=1 Tax=Cercophora newfieldiana TaxID=92897 RepID=A0AA39Y822_9PEZI|nr:amidase signature domain-containing protein [Cercophora newfieldiana]
MEPNLLTATAHNLQDLLSNKSGLTSEHLVRLYLAQIHRHDNYLRAMISTAPEHLLAARQAPGRGKSGPLHGISIILKDNIATKPATGLDTTAGSLALVNSRPYKSAVLVDRLLDAGAILLGKASLSVRPPEVSDASLH